ncbi:MAG: hypothetical protein ACI4V2_04060 [Alloprevotella sp.]
MSTITRFVCRAVTVAGLLCLTLALASCSDKKGQGKEGKEYIQDLKRQVKEKRQAKKQAQQEAFERLEREVLIFNAQCPFTVDDATVCSGCEIENGDVCYYYVVDEESLGKSISTIMESSSAGIKLNLIDNLRQAKSQGLLDLCRQCGANIIYRYGGETTGEVYDIRISLDEI